MAGHDGADRLGFVTPEKPQPRDLDSARVVLREWLAARLPNCSGLELSPLVVPEANGVANETLVFTAQWLDGAQSRSLGFVARLATSSPLFTGTDVLVQSQMCETLAREPGVPVPYVLGYEGDASLLGAPFFVMEKIEGVIPSDRPHYSLAGWVADAAPEQRRRLWRSAVETMARLHLVDPQRVSFLEHHELGATGLEQTLAFWRSYSVWAAEGREQRVMEEAGEWLQRNLPAHRPTSLAWGDARIGNMIFRDFTCVAVLDWDMVSLAGGESDLAWWILQDQGSAARLPGIGSLDETVELWEQLTSQRAVDLHYYLAFNAFRLGAIRIRLAHQMAATSGPSPELTELETNNVAIQQLALLLDIRPAGPITATLPELHR